MFFPHNSDQNIPRVFLYGIIGDSKTNKFHEILTQKSKKNEMISKIIKVILPISPHVAPGGSGRSGFALNSIPA